MRVKIQETYDGAIIGDGYYASGDTQIGHATIKGQVVQLTRKRRLGRPWGEWEVGAVIMEKPRKRRLPDGFKAEAWADRFMACFDHEVRWKGDIAITPTKASLWFPGWSDSYIFRPQAGPADSTSLDPNWRENLEGHLTARAMAAAILRHLEKAGKLVKFSGEAGYGLVESLAAEPLAHFKKVSGR